MLDMAIAVDVDRNGTIIIETNQGARLRAPDWPSDCDFQLVAFNPTAPQCEVIWLDLLMSDIAEALAAIDSLGPSKTRRSDWYHRLRRYSRGFDS
jgi:hypothetical protein